MPENAGSRKRQSGKKRSPVSRTAEIARRRERRGRLIRLTFIATVILALALFAGYQFWLRDSSLVAVKDLTVKGLDPDDDRDKPVAEATRLAVAQMTTLHPKPDLLREDLKRFPQVAGARISTSFPSSATVTITTRRDGATIGSGSNQQLVATDGTLLGAAGDRGADLPEIRPTGQVPDGGRLEGRDLAQALVLGGVPAKLRPYVDFSRKGPGGVEVTLSNGLVLAFGEATQVGQKWRAAAAILADPGLTDAVYVDLAVPRRPAVKSSAQEGQDGETQSADDAQSAAAG